MDARFRNRQLEHVECDEIWTFVGKKQSRLTVDEKAERGDIGDIYLCRARQFFLAELSGGLAWGWPVEVPLAAVLERGEGGDGFGVGRIPAASAAF